MNFGVWWCVLCVVCVCGGERWRWPEPQPAAAVRIDTKVRFLDQDDRDSERRGRVQADEVFQTASQTDGFYNRPEGVGRYPVRVESPHTQRDNNVLISHHLGKSYESDGTLDSLQYCKCVSEAGCAHHQLAGRGCGGGKYLCCYKGANKVPARNTEYFNEIEDERPSLLPGQEDRAHAFPPAPGGVLVGPGGPTGHVGPAGDGRQAVLVGPGGPTGNIGPASHGEQAVLVGPGGPTGNIGPQGLRGNSRGVLVGPGGPTGVLGPQRHEDNARIPQRNPGVLVGPEGPTNVIGPGPNNHNGPRDVGHSETAQRGVLVGPEGPTGIIGPRGYGQQRPVLVGPGGPTGIIGPRMQGLFNEFFGRQRSPGLLVGPGGPTGTIGPGRQLLVGPGGPSGRIGPQNYFFK